MLLYNREGWTAKRDGYPLPWCDAAGLPYWLLNIRLCALRGYWARWQSGKPMSQIIPRIDRLLRLLRL